VAAEELAWPLSLFSKKLSYISPLFFLPEEGELAAAPSTPDAMAFAAAPVAIAASRAAGGDAFVMTPCSRAIAGAEVAIAASQAAQLASPLASPIAADADAATTTTTTAAPLTLRALWAEAEAEEAEGVEVKYEDLVAFHALHAEAEAEAEAEEAEEVVTAPIITVAASVHAPDEKAVLMHAVPEVVETVEADAGNLIDLADVSFEFSCSSLSPWPTALAPSPVTAVFAPEAAAIAVETGGCRTATTAKARWFPPYSVEYSLSKGLRPGNDADAKAWILRHAAMVAGQPKQFSSEGPDVIRTLVFELAETDEAAPRVVETVEADAGDLIDLAEELNGFLSSSPWPFPMVPSPITIAASVHAARVAAFVHAPELAAFVHKEAEALWALWAKVEAEEADRAEVSYEDLVALDALMSPLEAEEELGIIRTLAFAE